MLTVRRCTDSEIDFGDMDLDESNDQLNKVFNPYEKKVKKLDSMQGVEQFRDQILLIEVPDSLPCPSELNELHYPVAAKKRKRDSDTSSASNEFQTNEQRKDTVSVLWKRLTNDPDRLIMTSGRARGITLRPVDHNDGLPSVGILFTEKEYWDLIQRHYRSSHFDETFFRNVFEVTGGHIGAMFGFIQAVMIDTSYKVCEQTNTQYTWSTFRRAFSTDEFMRRRLTHTSGAFTRGLPLDEDVQEYTKSRALSAALDRSPLAADMVKDDIQEGLEECVKRGWLHTDTIRDKDGTEESPIPLQVNLLEFMLGIIRLFDPAILSEERRIGPACIQRPPEAQYQDEFYRCSFKHPCGTYLSFPESGTMKGQASFYVPSKKWEIELLRDGNQLEEYTGVFSRTGAFDGTLLNDNIILDFRSSSPGIAHPNLQNLYHVVFDDNYETVCVLDNSLQPIPEGEFRLSKS
ncbi:hypothetical protein ACEPAG_1974 [Sanghuangporus baumii]